MRHGANFGVTLPTADKPPTPVASSAPCPLGPPGRPPHQPAAVRGGRDDGRLTGADGGRLTIADDLQLSLKRADSFFDERFRGVIEHLSVRYTMFFEDGTPARATVTLAMKQAKRLNSKKEAEEANKAAKKKPDCSPSQH